MGQSFNGVSLGLVFEMAGPAPNPNGRQVNAYAGADGLEVLDHGSRGGTTVVEGALVASSGPGLAALEQSLRSLHVDGGGYVLVDTLGQAWSPVILARFQMAGRVQIVAGGGFARRYTAEFLHVT
jgi:hypothetical protein